MSTTQQLLSQSARNGAIETVRWPLQPDGSRSLPADHRFVVSYDNGSVRILNNEGVAQVIRASKPADGGFKIEYVDAARFVSAVYATANYAGH